MHLHDLEENFVTRKTSKPALETAGW